MTPSSRRGQKYDRDTPGDARLMKISPFSSPSVTASSDVGARYETEVGSTAELAVVERLTSSGVNAPLVANLKT